MLNLQLTDLQHSLADLAILSARQEQLQQTCLEELRSLKTQPTTLPQPTWSTSPPQPIATFHPSRTPFAAGPSSLSPTTPPFHSSSYPVGHFPTSKYLTQSSSGSVFHPFDSDPHSSHHYRPPPATHGSHFTHAYSTPSNSPMTILAPDLQGSPMSTPAVLEFTTASLEPVLHRASLDKQVQRVTESVSSLLVCQDRLQTQPTQVEDGIESQLKGLDSTLGLNPSRALESTPSKPYPRPLIYSPPRTSIPHLEPVTKAPCSYSAVSITSLSPEIGSSPTVSLGTRQPATSNVTVSMFGSPSSPFAYTILPSHGPSLVSNSTNSTDALPHLSGCNDLDKGVQSMGFSLTHLDANLQLMRLHQLHFLDTTKTGLEICNSLNDCSGNSRVLLCWLPCDVFFNDSSGWFCKYLVDIFEKGILNAAKLFDEMSKRWSDGNMGTLFDFIYPPESDLDDLAIDLYVDFSLLFTSNLDFRPLWDPGNAVTHNIELMRCFTCQENHFDVHPQFLVLQLDLIHPAMHSTCLQPQMLATGI